ncbi:beta-ketoacyl-ACP synthase III [Geoalkalibacter halelectricus]|uniref:Beta-ketoacyl-ACP synthase III n=1 Tax=Geoalkalibacter halelectricus TaxID=2847045 RepID=A0ABY5ZTV7_9BACT|nr:beta-ketoacyl-ACP synthase III [Geoalkalibacter halelectricus]MDO3379837.1 beta-ketoacyl-ACP synthase III [Geoalkalibacter halelectricus]UWZ80631.1 beta-ketoacyl-ACP synthase III [Geoalkalibacter halelectricus]
MRVYINDIASFLPNEPINNDQMEDILGLVNQVPSRTRRIILRNNKIATRHYAIDPATGLTTHSNAQLTAEAVRRLDPYPGFSMADIECLACGTSSPDQIMPGHALMVHGEIGAGPCEAMSASGICIAGMTAMKYAYMSVALGQTRNAVATGSELASTFLRARLCPPVSPEKVKALDKTPVLSFDADFLRWMLSDGAGAAFLAPEPRTDGISLRIEWIDSLSFAHELETCMYAGATKNPDGSITGWREHPSLEACIQNEAFLIKQDVKLLNKEIIPTAVGRTLTRLIKKHALNANEIDWFLPHYSSDYFRQSLHDHMRDIGFFIPMERWFTNLTSKGNTGAASIYIILEELFHSGKLRRNEKLLCFIPESGRFSMCYMLLTVV